MYHLMLSHKERISRYPVYCILAVDSNNGIAKNKLIPWKIFEDMKYFKEITKSGDKKNVVIMGRNTWEDMGYKPLSDRINIVISTTFNNIPCNDCFVCNSPDNALELVNQMENIGKIFIIGGKKLYDEFINDFITERVYLTKIDHDYQTDTIIDFDLNNFKVLDNNQQIFKCHNTGSDVNVEFMILEKKQNVEEKNYLNLLKNIIDMGNYRPTRNEYTKSLFGASLKFDLSKSFPLLTTKKMFLKGIFEELKFFLLGQTNTKILEDKKVNIWKGNTNQTFLNSVGLSHYKEGDMGPMYGFQMRHFGAEYNGCDENYDNKGVDQLKNVINLLKTDKYSRRIMMTTYNPAQVSLGVLPPCHGIVIQFGIEDNNKLSCHTYQRSADFFHGIPFNIASYGLLIHIICELINNDVSYTGDKFYPGNLTIALGDYHVYEPHFDIVKEQLKREPYLFPQLKINKKISSVDDLNNIEFSDIELLNYNFYPTLKADMVA